MEKVQFQVWTVLVNDIKSMEIIVNRNSLVKKAKVKPDLWGMQAKLTLLTRKSFAGQGIKLNLQN